MSGMSLSDEVLVATHPNIYSDQEIDTDTEGTMKIRGPLSIALERGRDKIAKSFHHGHAGAHNHIHFEEPDDILEPDSEPGYYSLPGKDVDMISVDSSLGSDDTAMYSDDDTIIEAEEEDTFAVDLPLDIFMLIIEEVTCPDTLAKLARVSRTFCHLAQKKLYSSIGMTIGNEISLFPVRPTSFRLCKRHAHSRHLTRELASNSTLLGFVQDLVIADSRDFNEDVDPLVPMAISKMHNLRTARWVSFNQQPKEDINLPHNLKPVLNKLGQIAPNFEEWHMEFPVVPGRSRVEPDPLIIPANVKVLTFRSPRQNPNIAAIGRYLESPQGKKLKSLTFEGAFSWSHMAKRAAIGALLPNPSRCEELVQLESLNLRSLGCSRMPPETSPFNLLDRSTLKHLMLSGCNYYQHLLDGDFSEEKAPIKLESLYISGCFEVCKKFFNTLPPLKELALNVEVVRELKGGSAIRNYLQSKGGKLERLSLTFSRPKGMVFNSTEPLPDHDGLERQFMHDIVKSCQNVRELGISLTFKQFDEHLQSYCEIISLFPNLRAVYLNTKAEYDLWTPQAPLDRQLGFPVEEPECRWARQIANTYINAYGADAAKLRHMRVNEFVWQVTYGVYDNPDFGTPRYKGPEFRYMRRRDIDEDLIPKIFLLSEMNGETDGWAVDCDSEFAEHSCY